MLNHMKRLQQTAGKGWISKMIGTSGASWECDRSKEEKETQGLESRCSSLESFYLCVGVIKDLLSVVYEMNGDQCVSCFLTCNARPIVWLQKLQQCCPSRHFPWILTMFALNAAHDSCHWNVLLLKHICIIAIILLLLVIVASPQVLGQDLRGDLLVQVGHVAPVKVIVTHHDPQ